MANNNSFTDTMLESDRIGIVTANNDILILGSYDDKYRKTTTNKSGQEMLFINTRTGQRRLLKII